MPAASDNDFHEAAIGNRDEPTDAGHDDRLRLLGTLAASLAHEVNNLLTPVIGYAQLARRHPDDQHLQSKALDRTVASGEAAASLVQALLRFAVADESGAIADVGLALDEAIACMGFAVDRGRVTLERTVPAAVGVVMPQVSLQQVFMNLLLNAIGAMPSGGTVRVGAQVYPDGMVTIIVADTGPGLPAAIARDPFRPFQTRQSEIRRRSSHGLGLSICKRLVDLAGGVIQARSVSGRGTTFVIRLRQALVRAAA